jgi:hypothetical protein
MVGTEDVIIFAYPTYRVVAHTLVGALKGD